MEIFGKRSYGSRIVANTDYCFGISLWGEELHINGRCSWRVWRSPILQGCTDLLLLKLDGESRPWSWSASGGGISQSNWLLIWDIIMDGVFVHAITKLVHNLGQIHLHTRVPSSIKRAANALCQWGVLHLEALFALTYTKAQSYIGIERVASKTSICIHRCSSWWRSSQATCQVGLQHPWTSAWRLACPNVLPALLCAAAMAFQSVCILPDCFI